MKPNAYNPQPISTADVVLPKELTQLAETIAENVHDVWAKGRIDDGWTYGAERNDARKEHPCLIPYDQLTETEKAYDRNTALETLKLITKLGFRILPMLLILFCLPAKAQVVQQGRVVEYRGRDAKTALTGVEVAVSRAAKVMTKDDGGFTLKFNTAKPGARVSVLRVEKPGYEIFNREALDQWNVNPEEPFTIVMCKSDEFRRLRDRYSEVSSASYARQKAREEDQLRRKLQAGKLKENEYRAELEKLAKDYEEKLANIEEYADRFARIDLSEVSEVERRVVAYVERGELDSAITLYEQQNYLEKYMEAAAAHQALVKAEQKVRTGRDSMMAAIHRQVDTYRLAGGAVNYQKIYDLLKGVADADTTNVEAVAEFAVFCQEEMPDFGGWSRQYREIALQQPVGDKLIYAFLLRETFDKEQREKALTMLAPMLNEDTLHVLPQIAQLQCDLAWELLHNNLQEAERLAQQSLAGREYMFRHNPNGIWHVGHIYQQSYQSELGWSQALMADIHKEKNNLKEAERYHLAALENVQQTMTRENKLQYRRDYMYMLGRVAGFYEETGQAEKATQHNAMKEQMLTELAHENPEAYMNDLIGMYVQQGREEEALQGVEAWAESFKGLPERERTDAISNIYWRASFWWSGPWHEECLIRALNTLEQASDSVKNKIEWDFVYTNQLLIDYYCNYDKENNTTEHAEKAEKLLDHSLSILMKELTTDPTTVGWFYNVRWQYYNLYHEVLQDEAKAIASLKETVETATKFNLLHILEDEWLDVGLFFQFPDAPMPFFLRTLADDAAKHGDLDTAMGYIVKSEEWSVHAGRSLRWLAQEMSGEWTMPKHQQVKFTPKSFTQPTEDIPLYLYNIEAGQFLNCGNGWGTQASVDTVGMAFTLKLVPSQVKLKQKGWTFSGAKWHKPMFYDQGGAAFLDLARQDKHYPDCHLWTIKEKKGGGYTLQISPTCSLFKNEYFGWVEKGHDARTGEDTRTEASPRAKATDGITWFFLTEEQYQAQRAEYLTAARAAAENNARIVLYNRVNDILQKCNATPEQRRTLGQRLLQKLEAEK